MARRADLFENIEPIEASLWLLETLKKAKLVPLRNEKAKAERVISHILLEIAEAYIDKITLFSGEELSVDSEKDLAGECDFFFTLVPQSAYLETPLFRLLRQKTKIWTMAYPNVPPNSMAQNSLMKWKARIFLCFMAVLLMA